MRGISALLLIAGAILVALYFFNFDIQRPGALPEVEVEGGALPKGDVEVGDIDVGERTITVPTIDFDSPEEEAAERRAGAEDDPTR